MRAEELGAFLRSRRERVDPADVGFPATVRRRAPGLRREELSSLAGVAVSWLAKLERARLVSQLRPHRAEWPDDPELTDVIERLQASSPRFAELWAAHDVAPFVTTRRVFDHPTMGRLELDHHRLSVLDQAGSQLVVYTPVS